MLGKVLKKYCLIVVLLVSTSLGTTHSLPKLPKFLCLRPPFNAIHKFYNNKSIFLSDMTEGRFWSDLTEDTTFPTINDMNIGKTNVIHNLQIGFKTFDNVFNTDFNDKCVLESEKLYGLALKTHQKPYYTDFSFHENNKWSKASKLESSDQIRVNHPVLYNAFKHLNASKRIKAVLNFKVNGFLFIQDQKPFYMYCGSEDKWNVITENVTQEVIIFENDYKLHFGDIFSGFVDQEAKLVYLFEGRLTSANSIVRKFVHKCKFEYQKKEGKPYKQIKLFCEKLYYKDVCKKEEPLPIIVQEDNTIRYALIGVGIVFAILVVILLVLIYIRCPKKGSVRTKKEPSPVQPVKRTLAENRQRVIGENKTPPKKLAKERTQVFELKT